MRLYVRHGTHEPRITKAVILRDTYGSAKVYRSSVPTVVKWTNLVIWINFAQKENSALKLLNMILHLMT
jgi:hypothetical protein